MICQKGESFTEVRDRKMKVRASVKKICKDCKIIKRKGAKLNDIIISSGPFGYSSAGLSILQKKKKYSQSFGIKAKNAVLKNENIQTILKQETFAKRYILLKGYLKQNPNLLIEITSEGTSYQIPILSYLLIEGFEQEALSLVEDKIVNSFQVFDFNGNEYNDILISILNNQDDYFKKVTKINADNINKQFKFN